MHQLISPSTLAAACLGALALLVASFLAAKIAGYLATVAAVLAALLAPPLRLVARVALGLGALLARACRAGAARAASRWRGRCAATVTALPGAAIGPAAAREAVAALERGYGRVFGHRVSVVFLAAGDPEGGLRRDRDRVLVEIGGDSRSAAEAALRRAWRRAWPQHQVGGVAPETSPPNTCATGDAPPSVRRIAALPDAGAPPPAAAPRPVARDLAGERATDPLRPVRRA